MHLFFFFLLLMFITTQQGEPLVISYIDLITVYDY